MDEERKLTKKERKQLAKQERVDSYKKERTKGMMIKWSIIIVSVVVVVGGLWWAIAESSKPLPGQAFPDLGRDHVTDISDVKYNSNPPTSGKHFPVWAKRGVYDRALSDGYLVHSLEHGYIVISYNCMKPISNLFVQEAFAQEVQDASGSAEASGSARPFMHMNAPADGKMSAFTPDNPPSVEVALPKEFSSKECKDLVSSLSKFLDKAQRIIIVPRPSLDSRIALTAWTRIDKIDKMEKVDSERINKFIDAFHNKGPEATVE